MWNAFPRQCFFLWMLQATCLCMISAALLQAAEPSAGKVKFNRDIRQLLSDSCYHCHGPDDKHREADLRLDQRDAALTAKALIPGKADQSELIKRINETDPMSIMPPPESGKKLTAAQKKLLADWINQGAEYEAHWSFTPLVRPAVPVVKAANLVQNPIDAYLLAELAEQQLSYSPMAERATLLRRVSLDLIGLPPTPAEVAAFVNDTSPDAYERVIDRLLKSPHFGERWAVWWFDVARFTDTVGFHGDQNQRNFPYRDYVIDAFNRNLPFDQFTREQLAGDLLPNPTPEQLTASGFNRLNMMTREGGAQPKEYLAKYQADRVRTVGAAWLGATLGCCECHNHKFDPFTQKDFYSISAFFADVRQWGVYADYGYTMNPELKGFNNEYPFPPEALVDSRYLKQKMEQLKQLYYPAQNNSEPMPIHERDRLALSKAWTEQIAQFLSKNPSGWQPAIYQPPVVEAPAKEKNDKEKQAATTTVEPVLIDAAGYVVPKYAKVNKADTKAPAVANFEISGTETPLLTIKLELGTSSDAKQPVKRNGVKLTTSIVSAKGKPRNVPIFFAQADQAKPKYNGGAEVLGVQGGWSTPTDKNDQVLTSVWLLDQPVKLKADEQLQITLAGDVSPVRVTVSPFVSLDLLDTKPEEADDQINRSLALATADKNPEQAAQIKSWIKEYAACNGGKAWTLISEAMKNPLPTRILPRGNWQDESQPELLPATLSFLPALPNPDNKRLTRLDLANWICSQQNPLTARTLMNRLWKEFFGRGISQAVDDLGAQGDAPSHPELLDWLAVEFRDNRWDLQRIMKLMVMSRAYQQSSRARPELRVRDPLNRWLAYQNPRRLDAEFIRDNALFVSGLLNPEQGGPSVKPYQPADYYDQLQFPNRDYVADRNQQQYRRGVYMHWQRTFLHPMLANFDAPSREECTAIRVSSNTPQQALTLLNDPSFSEAAKALALKLREQASLAKATDAEKLNYLYQRVLLREPTATESASLLKFLAAQREEFSSGKSTASKVLAIGLLPVTGQRDAAMDNELAAWMSVCRVLLNLHETITRQ
jgi:hypothetical protein